jgi:small subunit ribosomal protein S8e
MALWQGKSRRKVTGREQQITIIGKDTKKMVRTRGGNLKFRVLTTSVVNVYDPKSKKTIKTDIKTVLENPANPHYVRRNVITKGAIIETEKGKAKVTSRPGQHGVINAILLKD